MPSKNQGGRPKKYVTEDEARRADIQKRQHRRRQQPQGPADFIAYEPPLHHGIPIDTPPTIGLRTSPDVCIPQDLPTNVQQDECSNPIQPPNIPPEQSTEFTEEIRKIRVEEQESIEEQAAYEVEVAEILAGMRADNMPSMAEDIIESVERRGERDEGLQLQRSCFSPNVYIDDPIIRDSGSSVASYSSHDKSASAQRSNESNTPSQVPIQQPVLGNSKSSSSSRRSVSFPAQKNTLLSWMKPMPQEPSAPMHGSHGATTPLPISSSNATPVPPTPTPINVIDDALATPTPIRVPLPAVATSTALPEPPIERTAIKLARQLRSFQGCTHEQHQEADRLHREHHQRPDVHSECSSLQQITTLLRGNHNGGTPLPDVLGRTKLMKPGDFRGLDCQAAFEGSSSSFTEADRLPKNLCLAQHYATSKKSRRPEVSFDIDSMCCFPTSLGVASRGIKWFPKVHSPLNLVADIHFGLRVFHYNRRGEISSQYAPLHKSPHYCFGTMIGMESVAILIFFPRLYQESDYEHSSYLSNNDQQLWYDGILNPCINKVIGSSNIIQHFPATSNVANVDSTAASAESFSRKHSSREQILGHDLQPQYLDSLWTLILQTIADNPGFHRFEGATLFMNAKNTKLQYMRTSLTNAYDTWEEHWSKVADPQFYNRDRTFIDLAKQVTSEDSALPYDQIPEEHEAEVFLWKKCCLDAYSKTRSVTNADGSRAKGNPKRTTYPWATMRDTIGQTLFAAPRGKESTDGLIYSQFYALIKTPFDSAKVYIFDNDSVENLALDPGYIRSLQQEGGSITFSKAVCEFSYLHGKKRAHANLVDNRWKSYGIREEHRISLSMMEEIYQQWHQWDLYDDDDIDNAQSPLPYYIVPTQELLAFLYGQINKYCFLFEHILAHTARTYSLPETVVMVIALRALRFCYGSNLLQRESLLYKDRWEKEQGHSIVIKEGLGMKESIERCGLGWFLPKFNWVTWRLAPPHGENILVGNMLVHEEYKRRWRAVKDLRDVFVRFNQAESWYDRYDMQSKPNLQLQWLEYLHALNLEQFDIDVWKSMLRAHKRSPELGPEVVQQHAKLRFCHREMRKAFLVDGVVCGPHIVTGNKMRFSEVMELFHFLFLWDDKEQRTGWGSKPYRVILQKTCELVDRRLGDLQARKWMEDFFHLVRLTHWILPYPSNSSFITATKTSQSQGLKGRMMWFSLIYKAPEAAPTPAHWPHDHPLTLFNVVQHAKL